MDSTVFLNLGDAKRGRSNKFIYRYDRYTRYTMSISVSIKVRRELVELADKMVRYGIARSRSHAFNIMIEKGLSEVLKEVENWEDIYKRAEEMEKQGFKLRHGGLSKLLEEERNR
ncbi:MAG: hypothetical protein ACUX7D_01330 [Candidatus Methanodesulfokora washburnensis]|jgi:uncharacterized protein YggE